VALVYSRRFSDAVYGGNATDHQAFVVPAGRIYVVRYITAWTDVAGNQAMLSRTGGARLVYWTSTEVNQSFGGDVRLVLNAGEALVCHVFNGGWHVSTHGFDFAAA